MAILESTLSNATTSSKLGNRRAGPYLVALAAMMWGSDVLLRPKVLAAGIDSVSVVLLEHLALTILFLPILIKNRKSLRLNGKELFAVLFIAIAGSTLGTVLLTQAYVQGDPLTATLLQKLQPLFAILTASVLLKERQRPMFWPLFVIGLGGAYLISFGFTSVTDPFNHKGFLAAVYAVSAAALWGCCTAVGRWALNHLDALPVAGLRFAFALPVLALWALIGGHSVSSQQLHRPFVLIPLALIVLIPDALGMALYYFGLKDTPASIATLAEMAYPATAIMLSVGSATKFNEAQWAGIVILFGSLYLIRWQNLVQAVPVPA